MKLAAILFTFLSIFSCKTQKSAQENTKNSSVEEVDLDYCLFRLTCTYLMNVKDLGQVGDVSIDK